MEFPLVKKNIAKVIEMPNHLTQENHTREAEAITESILRILRFLDIKSKRLLALNQSAFSCAMGRVVEKRTDELVSDIKSVTNGYDKKALSESINNIK